MSEMTMTRPMGGQLADMARLVMGRLQVELRQKMSLLTLLGGLVVPAIVYYVYSTQEGVLGGDAARRGLVLSYLSISLFLSGLVTLSSAIMTDQDDGSLLRMKLLPGGIGSYLAAKVTMLTFTSLAGSLAVVVAAHLAIGDVLPTSARVWLLLLPFALFCMACTAPIGITVGCLSLNVMMSLPVMMLGFGLMFISGVMIPFGAIPETLQTVAKVFPLYWLGEISRDIFGENPISLRDLTVPMAWLVGGAIVAPAMVRRMSRRQSGGRLNRTAERKVQRGY